MTEFIQFILCAFLIEEVWENLKMIWQDGKFCVDKLGVLLLACSLSVISKQDIFLKVNLVEQSMIATQIFTGFILSSGGKVAHELMRKISSLMAGDVNSIDLDELYE